jgi:hypothetical protein
MSKRLRKPDYIEIDKGGGGDSPDAYSMLRFEHGRLPDGC